MPIKVKRDRRKNKIQTSAVKKERGFARLGRDIKKHKLVYVMAIPVVLYYLIFCYAPMGGLVMAFQDFKITKGFFRSEFVGLKNFLKFFKARDFWNLMRNTFMLNVYDIIFCFPVPVVIALLLNELQSKRFKATIQTMIYMPNFISVVILCGLVLDFCAREGVVNDILAIFGFERSNLMMKASLFKPIFIITNIWQLAGWTSIVYMAALSNINTELYDAAYVDGCGRWKRLWHVTLPGLMPTVITMTILRMGSMLSVGYEKVILLYNDLTMSEADVISSFVYRMGIKGGAYGYSTAVGLFNAVINLVLLLIANSLSRKLTEQSLW